MKVSRRSERGYNLAEMLVAVALTGVVILSILTLFTLARSNVYAGRQMTNAISVGTRIMEDLSGLPLADVYSAFGITDATALGTVTVVPSGMSDSSYDGSIVRAARTDTITTAGVCDLDPATAAPVFSGDPGGYLSRWYCQMQTAGNILPSGTIHVVFTPRKTIDDAAPLSPDNAGIVRIRTIIRWKEGLRQRQLVLDTEKFNRPLPE